MDTDDLRSALESEAAHEPAPSPDLRARVAGDVRRRRVLTGVAAVPVVLVLVLLGALVATRGPSDTLVDTASAPPGSVPGTSTPAPVTVTSVVTDVPAGVTTAPAPAAPSTPAGVVECGTVTVEGMVPGAGGDPKGAMEAARAAYECTAKAVNGGSEAHVAVVAPGSVSGSIAVDLRVTSSSVRAEASGSSVTALPAGIDKLMGGASPSTTGPVDCGTITVSPEAMKSAKPDLMCLFEAVRGGGSLKVVVPDQQGGAITADVSIATAPATVTVSVSGSVTMTLPPGTTLPEDLFDRFGALGHAGLGGLGTMGDAGQQDPGKQWPGRKGRASTTTVAPAGN